MEFFLTTVLKLIPFLRVTILIAFTSMALGLIFGTLLAAMKMCRIKMLKTIANQVYAGDCTDFSRLLWSAGPFWTGGH